jgi:hypothetical protein
MDKGKVAKALKFAARHDDAARANGWEDNEVTERTAGEFNAIWKTMTSEERELFNKTAGGKR